MNAKKYGEKEKKLQDLEFDLICDFIRLRKKKGWTQKDLAQLAGVYRENVSIVENQIKHPGINTMIKILEPMGYTLAIVPIKNKKNS